MKEEEEPLPLQEREGLESPDDEDDGAELNLSRSDKFRRTIRRKSFNTQHLSCLLATGSAVFTETREANFLDDDGTEPEQNSSLLAHFEEFLLSMVDLSTEVSKLKYFKCKMLIKTSLELFS